MCCVWHVVGVVIGVCVVCRVWHSERPVWYIVGCVCCHVCCVSRDSLPSTLHRTHKVAAVTADTGGT